MGWEESDLPVGVREATQGDSSWALIPGLWADGTCPGAVGTARGSGIPGFAARGLAQVALGPGGFFLQGCRAALGSGLWEALTSTCFWLVLSRVCVLYLPNLAFTFHCELEGEFSTLLFSH